MKAKHALRVLGAAVWTKLVSLIMVIPAYASFSIGGGNVTSLDEPVDFSEFSGFFTQYKAFAVAITGICAVTSLAALGMSIAKFSASGGNDMARRQAITGILVSGAALAVFGGATVIIGVFWNLFTPGATTP